MAQDMKFHDKLDKEIAARQGFLPMQWLLAGSYFAVCL
jgi:hypothetical protein